MQHMQFVLYTTGPEYDENQPELGRMRIDPKLLSEAIKWDS